ncbi:hypothetical protein BCIN_15g04680 [Botrytis cinerea B05.10]|uniref:Uncharacterized protein n=1 Tax=Botryotinia fuckeliana (strain B05.10) TaxID=332648 RepID=A0A384K591_BOTFB|nr:hypothetical protein BCIN_15g04680 [Botrytis cinerea B05.10]ATZ57968.1 hypothetical protein BCIN_15g04680 [Botrytis cinerea B05.10]
MDKSHATYLSPQDLLRSYQPPEAPFSAPPEEEIGGQEDDVLLIPIDIPVNNPESSGVLYSGPLEEEIIEQEEEEEEEEISIIPINLPESSPLSYASPFLEETAPTEEQSINLDIPLRIPTSLPQNSNPSPKSHTPYSLRYEISSPSPRATIVTHKDIGWLSDAGVRGSVSTVCHGTFHSQPATLILFSFIFRSGDHGFRFKNANVKIDFSRYESPSSSSTSTPASASTPPWTPSIAQLAPRKIYGLPTTTHQTQQITGEISLQLPLGAASLGPSTSLSRESSFSLSHRYSLVGNIWSRARSSAWDSAYWDIRENKRTKQGIPDRVDVGVVVCRDGEGSFQGEVKVEVDTPVMRGVWGWPWGRGNSVVFMPGVESGGERVRTRRFEELGERDWRGLVGWEGEWVDVVVGNTEGGRGEEKV